MSEEKRVGDARSPVKGHELLRAVEIVDALRGEGGDLWSAEQTHQSLARYLLEEAHEVIAVLEDPRAYGPTALPDELGDLLFQILFHARVGEEGSDETTGHHRFSIDDVARAFNSKMERRNPHIFATGDTARPEHASVEDIVAQWHAVKASEGKTPSIFGDIPQDLPALYIALKVVHRARNAGQLEELLAAARSTAEDQTAPALEGAQHALALLEVAVAAEAEDIDPESALRTLLRRTQRRFGAAEG